MKFKEAEATCQGDKLAKSAVEVCFPSLSPFATPTASPAKVKKLTNVTLLDRFGPASRSHSTCHLMLQAKP
jgi:hypothetical protein